MVTTRAQLKKTLIAAVCSNDDLLTEILSRLPAKSILRFKSVSKYWLALLSQRYFTLLYDNRLISSGFFYRSFYFPFDVENPSPPKPFFNLSYYPNSHGMKIMQPCNGLLLCFDKATREYYVFNPTTDQSAVIPSYTDGQGVGTYFICMGLAFHPTDCVHFKIVYIYGTSENLNPKGTMCQIHVYSSETGERNILHETFYVNYGGRSLSHHGVYWNGTINWPTSMNDGFYFKLDTEQLQNFMLPEREHYCFYFGESRGHLHLVKAVDDFLLNVYEMLSDHSGWFIKYQVELKTHIEGYFGYPYNVIDVVRAEEEEDTFMVVIIPTKVIRYNVMDNTCKPISYVRGGMSLNEKGHRYIESIGSF